MNVSILRQSRWDVLRVLQSKRASTAVQLALAFVIFCVSTFWIFQTLELAHIGKQCDILVDSIEHYYTYETTHKGDGYGYVFYAISDNYACSALVNIHILQADLNTPYPIYALVGPDLSQSYKDLFEQNNVTVIVDEPPPLNQGSGYYQGVLLKLYAFRMHHYVPTLKRVIIMDSDQLIVSELDVLFELPDTRLACPRAYWLTDSQLTTTLMVISLSNATWELVENALKNIGPDTYDMDLINQMFSNSALTLPGQYATLNSHWEAWDVPTWFTGEPVLHQYREDEFALESTNQSMTQLYDAVKILHFSAIGKPWDYSEESAAIEKPHAHPLLARQFGTWNAKAKEICQTGEDGQNYGIGPEVAGKNFTNYEY